MPLLQNTCQEALTKHRMRRVQTLFRAKPLRNLTWDTHAGACLVTHGEITWCKNLIDDQAFGCETTLQTYVRAEDNVNADVQHDFF